MPKCFHIYGWGLWMYNSAPATIWGPVMLFKTFRYSPILSLRCSRKLQIVNDVLLDEEGTYPCAQSAIKHLKENSRIVPERSRWLPTREPRGCSVEAAPFLRPSTECNIIEFPPDCIAEVLTQSKLYLTSQCTCCTSPKYLSYAHIRIWMGEFMISMVEDSSQLLHANKPSLLRNAKKISQVFEKTWQLNSSIPSFGILAEILLLSSCLPGFWMHTYPGDALETGTPCERVRGGFRICKWC